jgi:hypothetical protein
MPQVNSDLLLYRRRRTRKDFIQKARQIAIIQSEITEEEKERKKLEWFIKFK